MCLGKYGRRLVHGRADAETHVRNRSSSGSSSSSSCSSNSEESDVPVDLERLAQCGREDKGWYVNTVNVYTMQEATCAV